MGIFIYACGLRVGDLVGDLVGTRKTISSLHDVILHRLKDDAQLARRIWPRHEESVLPTYRGRCKSKTNYNGRENYRPVAGHRREHGTHGKEDAHDGRCCEIDRKLRIG